MDGLARPRLLLTFAAATVAGLVLPFNGEAHLHAAAPAPRLNPIQVENALSGTDAWEGAAFWGGAVEGYASEESVAPGGSLDLHVSTTPAAQFRVDIYRLGWYSGLGGRLVACLPGCSALAHGSPEPVPSPDAVTGLAAAAWPITFTVRVPSTWTSGYYVAKVVLESGSNVGMAAPIFFVVRAPAASQSSILVIAPVNTWAAYNNWGGKSLYAFNSTEGRAATKVSFDRPYGGGIQWPFSWELQLVRFLEREGYDVSYTTDFDVSQDPGELLRHRLIITNGHDEYWTVQMRDAFESARATGTNLAFMGADTGDGVVRYEDSGRTLVDYRDPSLDPIPDPSEKTGRFRSLSPPRPECSLIGVQYGGLETPPVLNESYTVAADDPWFAGTGLMPGVQLPGLVGYEWDSVVPGCVNPAPTVLFRNDTTQVTANAVRYTFASGARVFSAGSLQFSWGLDSWGTPASVVDPRLQQFMRNALTDLTHPAPPAEVASSLDGPSVVIQATLLPDPRVNSLEITREEITNSGVPVGKGVRKLCALSSPCIDNPPGHLRYVYSVSAADRWAVSAAVFTQPIEVPNHSPTLELHGPRFVRVGGRVTFTASTHDNDGDPIRLMWRIDGSALRSSVMLSRRVSFRRAGVHVVTATAIDSYGASTTRAITIHVRRDRR